MRQITVNKNDANQRVDKFVSKTLKTLPKNLMYKYIRNKKIKRNGKRCSIEEIVQEGDVFTCYIAEEFFEIEKDRSFLQASSKLDVVYEDDNIIIMNKEVGLLVHSESISDIDTLVNRMKRYLHDKEEYQVDEEQSFTPALAHRLDRNTQGLVIGAKNAESLRALNQLIKDHKIHKNYYAIVQGELSKDEALLVHYHKKENQEIFVQDYQTEDYKIMKTSYKVLKINHGYSFLDITLHTGRTHQIRTQFAHIGHPLLGDRKYGAKPSNFKYQALCAYQLCFDSEENNQFSYLHQKVFRLQNTYIEQYFLNTLKGTY